MFPSTVHLSLSLTTSSYFDSLRIWIGGGSHANAEAAVPGTSSTKKGAGWYNGYVIIRKITGLDGPGLGVGGPGPAGKSGKKDGKTGKTETEAIFT